jgi:hypothetical protein
MLRTAVGGSASAVEPDSADPLVAARHVWAALTDAHALQRYIMIMQGNGAMAPMVRNWMCNTKFMDGVHNRTLVIMSDQAGYDGLAGNEYGVRVARMRLLAPELAQSFTHGTYGYWKLTEARVQMLSDLVDEGIAFLNWEPDAIWLRNPLGDAELVKAAASLADIAISSDIDTEGRHFLAVGLMLVRSNARTKQLFRHLKSMLSSNIRSLGPHKYKDDVGASKALMEQEILEGLLTTGYANITHHQLNPCVYAGGLWYKPEEITRRRNCILKHGVPVLINNNWIIGNDAKIQRAKDWGHWFISSDGMCDAERVAKAITYYLWPPTPR